MRPANGAAIQDAAKLTAGASKKKHRLQLTTRGLSLATEERRPQSIGHYALTHVVTCYPDELDASMLGIVVLAAPAPAPAPRRESSAQHGLEHGLEQAVDAAHCHQFIVLRAGQAVEVAQALLAIKAFLRDATLAEGRRQARSDATAPAGPVTASGTAVTTAVAAAVVPGDPFASTHDVCVLWHRNPSSFFFSFLVMTFDFFVCCCVVVLLLLLFSARRVCIVGAWLCGRVSTRRGGFMDGRLECLRGGAGRRLCQHARQARWQPPNGRCAGRQPVGRLWSRGRRGRARLRQLVSRAHPATAATAAAAAAAACLQPRLRPRARP